jgi:parallel beta-helix repeat protein
MKRVVSGIVLALLLVSMWTGVFRTELVKALNETVYIRADGSIDPPDAPISTVDNVTYTLIGNITSDADGIVVERSNIIIDGNGYTLQGTGAYASKGIDLSSRSNITSKNTNIKDFSYGILLSESSNISITGNNITNNSWGGIGLWNSRYNSISGNHITNNGRIGITLTGLFGSSNNSIVGNVLVNDGLSVWDSYGNVVVDNLVNRKPLVYLEGVSDVVVEDAGEVVLVNCNRIIVENLNLSNTYIGVQLWQTNNATISGNNITNNGYGIELESSSNHNNIIGNHITNNSEYGIRLIMGYNSKYNSIVGNYIINNRCGIESGAENSISGNHITNNTYHGIELESSYYSSIVGNSVTNNGYGGIYLDSSNYNNITENEIANNSEYGIRLYYSSNNRFWHNNFIDNAQQVLVEPAGYANVWDDDYPSGGNYWSDCNGTDLYSGSYQNATGSDGIGDTEYAIDGNNTDHYPLMGMFSEFDWISIAAPEQRIQTVCNSTMSNLVYNGTAINFDVTGDNGTSGFCRIRIPKVFMNSTFAVFVNGTEIAYTLLPCSNETYSYLYFNYTHSTQEVIIIPEFPSFLMSLFMIATLLAFIAYKRKHCRTD